MSELRPNDTPESTTIWRRQRFFVLIAGVIIISLFLVSVAMSMYNNGGAAQVDMSRPGYQSIRKQVNRDTTVTEYAASGELDTAAFDEFNKLYADRSKKVLEADSFSGNPLSTESLQLFSTTTQNGTTTQ